MVSVTQEFNSIKITRILLKIVGFWHAENQKEQLILDCCKLYTMNAIIGAVVTQAMEFVISKDSVYVSLLLFLLLCTLKMLRFY